MRVARPSFASDLRASRTNSSREAPSKAARATPRKHDSFSVLFFQILIDWPQLAALSLPPAWLSCRAVHACWKAHGMDPCIGRSTGKGEFGSMKQSLTGEGGWKEPGWNAIPKICGRY